MNKYLQEIVNLLQQGETLSAEQKAAVLKSLKNADKELEITTFKLDRTEKVKKTTAILLEETIEELEQKRKAVEAQNKELEIEAALEKVRSRSLAMYKSDELKDVVKLVFKTLEELKFAIDGAAFIATQTGDSKNTNIWIGDNHAEYPTCFKTPFSDVPEITDLWNAWETGLDFFSRTYNKEGKNAWFKYAFEHTDYKYLPDQLKTWILEQEYLTQSVAPAKNSMIGIHYHTQKTLTDSEIDILKRFSKIFEQSYTRFLDLQKAEAQARESQIQLALERVRARTMAMQKSDELSETVFILFQQFKQLGESPDQATIGIVNENEWVIEYWVTMYGNQTNRVYKFPIDEPNVTNRIYKAWKEQKKSLVIELSGKELFDFANFRESMGGAAYNAEEKKRVINVAFFSKGIINVQSNESRSAESILLLERFAAVFEQTYTRFLDLQKAEAQARESQIQLAMERVRARTMAMQHSDELKEAAALLFQQAKVLGVPAYSCGYNIWEKDDKVFTSWMSTQDGSIINGVPDIPLTEDANFIRYVESKEKGEPFFVLELRGERMQEHYQYLKTIPAFKGYFDYAVSVGFDLPKTQIHYLANFSHGNLLFIALEPCPEFHDVFKRFAAVFEQTYTRFLDLQKAEAQAREAQIEAALERVRSRSMAMHKSEELVEVVRILDKEIIGLRVEVSGTQIITDFANPEDGVNDWYAREGQDDLEKFHIPYLEHPITNRLINALNKNVDFYTENYSKAEKNKYFRLLFKYSDFAKFSKERQEFVYHSPAYNRAVVASKNSILIFQRFDLKEFTKEEEGIFKRFGKVFEQAYTRFLDLQKAEAQAREAEIQLALERVRAKTMAMQKQNDLLGVLELLGEQLVKLGVHLDIASFSDGLRKGDWDVWLLTPTPEGPYESAYVHFSQIDHPFFKETERNIETYNKTGTDFFKNEFSKKEKDSWLDYCFAQTIYSNAPQETKQYFYDKPGYVWSAFFLKETWVSVCKYTTTPFSDDEDALLRRFANAFGLVYTRFLDLQKAEGQAREAQIEAALERVRSRSMGMQKSGELRDVIQVVFEQLLQLNFKADSASFSLYDGSNDDFNLWSATRQQTYPMLLHIPYVDNPIFNQLKEAKKKGLDFFSASYSFEEKNAFWRHFFNHTSIVSKDRQQYILNTSGYSMSTAMMDSVSLSIVNYHGDSFSDAENAILKRFAKVFEQTYTRFLDLQKAEAQAREAHIEAALERVRSRSVAMRKSEEIADIAGKIFSELKQLDLALNRVLIWTFNDIEKYTTWWSSNPEVESTAESYRIDYNENPAFINYLQAWQQRKPIHLYFLGGDIKKSWEDFLFEHTELSRLPAVVRKSMSEEGDIFTISVISDYGLMMAGSLVPLSDANIDIIQRFGRVFQQSYTRYLDVQKAEAQAREARIENALEKVRSRTMAMHSSEDVSRATTTMFTELEKLGVENFRGGILNIRKNKTMDVWSVNKSADSDPNDPVGRGKTIRAAGEWDMTLHPWWKELYDGWANKDEFSYYLLTAKEKNDYVKILDARRDYIPGGIKELPDSHIQAYYFGEGAVWTFSLQPHSDEDKQVMKRFASVFSLTFRRYKDLQKAEAQAREATIEAALERVRARAMAMQTSEDVVSATSVLFSELDKLGIKTMRCGILIIDKKKTMEVWTSVFTTDGQITRVIGSLDMRIHPLLEGIFESWKQKEDVFRYKLIGDDIQRYYSALAKAHEPYTVLLQNTNVPDHYCHVYLFEEGGLYTFSVDEHTNEERQVLKRFTGVFSLTFRRYQDLKRAEAQAKEAIKQATLDRIRADIASMRTVADLDKITPLIWNELNTLGIPFIRCGVFIMDETQQLIHTFLSTPDGKAIAAFDLSYDTSGNLSKVLSHWKENKKYIDHWDQSAFTEMANILVRQGAIESPDQYLASIPYGGFYLHFLPFLQGMLYVGNLTQLGDEEINLLQSVAEAFSTAYARYEDFNKLEVAKKQVDSTLNELQATQKQLVQSEKMASLGELTAGIAHEIQNPLNFVNNFSDVNIELLEELNEEIEKGNYEEAKIIAADIAGNEEKISHHGKRADSIVKGMLQHSRSTSTTKEPTDINALADEYLRLAYHGLRAKDKSFNATMKTDYDETIKKINVIPQDIGRVILNVITNAFYTVNEKKTLRQAQGDGYEPAVTVSTKKKNDTVEIRIGDNGNGIPQKVVDKIFQPFFTTKPTGQGTGLGLSLAYDIVKTHGGELKVETKEDEGSEFIIQLPII